MADPGSPNAVVLEFYKLSLERFQPKDAFERYAAPDFVEHSTDIAGGTRQGASAFLEDLIQGFPLQSGKSFALQLKGPFVFCMSM